MSKQLKKSIKTGNIYQSNSKINGQRYHKKSIKTIEIFMKDIDKQLQQSYNKLKQSKYKQSNIKKTSQNISFEDNTIEDYSTAGISNQANVTNFSSKNQYDKENITLIDNKDVMEYINLVYQIYNIKDPMKETSNYQQQRPQKRPLAQRQYSTNKKIKDFKQHFQKTIGSASTLKNSYNFHQIQLNPFKNFADKNSKNPSRSSSPFINKVQIISLHSKNKSQANNFSNQKTSYSKESNIKNTNQIPMKKKLTIKQSMNKQISCQHIDNGLVPQLFRYCFMCQAPILESNLENHEFTCIPLKNALKTKQIPQITILLDQKIYRLKNEINKQFLLKDQKQINKDFTNIKLNVKKWMGKLPQNNRSYVHQQEWKAQYNKISQSINHSVCKVFQSVNKLQWFSRLKDNITNKYKITC